ncbi:MAG TPA: hypothetical protein VNY83_04850 [Solirubrobacterales bacterium]|jgi:hypothetical protein|nr:hypothetical protein [Solirubrobacterales bacterium]
MRRLKPAAFAVVVCAALAFHAPRAAAFNVLTFHPNNLQVEGGAETWHASNAFSVSWDNPPDSSVAVVHYRVREPNGTLSYEEQIYSNPRHPTQSIFPIYVREIPGEYTVEVWLQDPGGAQGPTATTKLRFDNVRPREAAPQPISGWIGRAAIPYSVRLSHPGDPKPISGIEGYAVSVDSNPSGNPCAAADRCLDGETDLRGGPDDDLLPVADLSEGTDYIHAVAVSGSGMRSQFVETTVVHVDTTMPVTRLDGVPGGWTNRPVALTATATDATSGMSFGGAFTAIRVGGGVPTTASGDSVSAAVIGEGVHKIAYYARDAAGNVNDGSGEGLPQQPSTAVVRIDRAAPAAAFVNSQNPEDPELIEVRVSDPMSGPDPTKGRIEVRRAASGEQFEALPTESAAGKLRAHWDSDAYPAGEYEFRATGYDAAGNSVTTARRANGTSMLLPSPLKAPTAVRTGFGGRTLVWHRCARKGGRRHCRREAVEPFYRRPTIRFVPYGRGTLFSGRLIAGLGSPLGRMPVQVIESFDSGGSPAQRVTTVETGADGVFTVHLAPGPSRSVTAVFGGTRTLTRSAAPPVRLGVRGGVRMRPSAPVAAIGGRAVVFHGEVEADGTAIPLDGKTVQLQFRAPGIPWTEFRTVQTDAHGRFRYPYSFTDDDSRGVRFQFRAFAPAQSDWPYEPASSGPVAVRGR